METCRKFHVDNPEQFQQSLTQWDHYTGMLEQVARVAARKRPCDQNWLSLMSSFFGDLIEFLQEICIINQFGRNRNWEVNEILFLSSLVIHQDGDRLDCQRAGPHLPLYANIPFFPPLSSPKAAIENKKKMKRTSFTDMKQSATYRFDTRRMFHGRPTVKETLKWVQVPPAGLVWKRSRVEEEGWGGAEWRATISFKKWRGLPTRNWDTAAVESATWFTIPPTVNEWLKPGRQTVTTRLFIIEPDSASVSYFSASKLTLLNELAVKISVKVTALTQRFVMIWFEFI